MTYVDDDGSSGSGDDVNILDGHKRQAGMALNSCGGRKRGRKATGAAIVDAMLEIVTASKMRASAIAKNEERFSINKCIKVLDEMQGVDEGIYFLALDLFEDHPNAREVFISLKNDCHGCRANVVFPLVELFEKISHILLLKTALYFCTAKSTARDDAS
ncbi:hypothetical protein DEO72_LG5g3143 [Vigna unguiculata]|uniref:Uncharacterized protein n=1 Tax=Vigna unguiculata TaxID=3917 RepID=A0A4D6M2P7_VIGUN|nr:hypothetical protein DEO72_LG5g3143 [Vigna unguiculata]